MLLPSYVLLKQVEVE